MNPNAAMPEEVITAAYWLRSTEQKHGGGGAHSPTCTFAALARWSTNVVSARAIPTSAMIPVAVAHAELELTTSMPPDRVVVVDAME